MGISKKNSEGYLDPTAYAALTIAAREEKQAASHRKKVYVCSPYRGKDEQEVSENVAQTIKYCRYAVKKGVFPICPHIYLTRFLNDGDISERRLGLALGIELLRECAEIWVFGESISEGMKREILAAQAHGIPLKHHYEDTEEK